MRQLLYLFMFTLGFACSAQAASYKLESKQYCNGTTILGWDGRSRSAFSQTVYDFSVDCGGKRYHVMDLFLASADSNRYQKRGGTLYKHTGDERKSVMVRSRECKLVPETVEVDPPANNPCYYDIMHPDCDPSKKYWATKMVKRCSQAQYETRYVAKWKPFPTGYSPLPQGARIVSITAPASTSSASTGSGSGIVLLILFAVFVIGAGAFLWKPIARFYYTAFVPHPAKKYLDESVANNKALDTAGFERAMYEAARGPFPDIMAAKGAKIRAAMDEHAAMMRSIEDRERARLRAVVSSKASSQIDKDYS